MFCRFCGTKISKDSKFCKKCGNNINEEENIKESINTKQVQSTPQDAPVLTDAEKEKYKGVGGWLTFFLIGLVITVFICLWNVYGIFNDSDIITTLSSRSGFFGLASAIELTILLSQAAFAIYIIFLLIKVADNAVKITKYFLIFALTTSFIDSFIMYVAFNEVVPEAMNTLITNIWQPFVRTLIYFAIWYTYFKSSKRVKATYTS